MFDCICWILEWYIITVSLHHLMRVQIQLIVVIYFYYQTIVVMELFYYVNTYFTTISLRSIFSTETSRDIPPVLSNNLLTANGLSKNSLRLSWPEAENIFTHILHQLKTLSPSASPPSSPTQLVFSCHDVTVVVVVATVVTVAWVVVTMEVFAQLSAILKHMYMS